MVGHSGKWMLGYEFGYERMNVYLDGSDRIRASEILQYFFASPTEMRMQMHSATLMYAPPEGPSLMAMVPYLVRDMDHVTVDGERFKEETDGLGDIELRADGRRASNIEGAHGTLDPEDEPTKDPSLQAGRSIDVLLGLNFQPYGGSGSEDQRFYLEAGVPAYQPLDGPQLRSTFVGRLNWQWHFN